MVVHTKVSEYVIMVYKNKDGSKYNWDQLIDLDNGAHNINRLDLNQLDIFFML